MTKGETAAATFSVRKLRYAEYCTKDETLDKFWYLNLVTNFIQEMYILPPQIIP